MDEQKITAEETRRMFAVGRYYATTYMTFNEIASRLGISATDVALFVARLRRSNRLGSRPNASLDTVLTIAGEALSRVSAQLGPRSTPTIMPRQPSQGLPTSVMAAFVPPKGAKLKPLTTCRGCRWPYDNGLFCDEPIEPGAKRPYCRDHGATSRRPSFVPYEQHVLPS